MNNNYYNKKLKGLARGMRNSSSRAEIRLWCELLRNKQLMGYSFLRQRSMENYILDFFCKELNLIIEVDGPDHQLDPLKDIQRDNSLILKGYFTLRFTNDEVMYDIDRVKIQLESWINDRNINKEELK